MDDLTQCAVNELKLWFASWALGLIIFQYFGQRLIEAEDGYALQVLQSIIVLCPCYLL